MGVNISGKGVLSGLVSFAIGSVNNFTLLASRVLGFTYVPSGSGYGYYGENIGDQGSGGLVETLAPVTVYTVPAGKSAVIDSVTVKNSSNNTITYDLAVLSSGENLTDSNSLINDEPVIAGATETVLTISSPQTQGKRIVVLPSAVDVVEVKVYGTESDLPVLITGNGSFTDKKFGYTYDGITWTWITGPEMDRWNEAVRGSDKFVSVGNYKFAYSLNGISWTSVTSSGNYRSVAYGNGKYVAVAQDESYIASSEDGITWTETSTSDYVFNVIYGNGKFLITGDSLVKTSVDGVNWTTTALSPVEGVNMSWSEGARYLNGKFIAYGYGFGISTDGVNWTTTTETAKDVAYINGKYYLLDGEYLKESQDAINWTTVTDGGEMSMPALRLNNSQVQRITYLNGNFIATSRSQIATSTNGQLWTIQTFTNYQNLNDIQYFDGKYVISGMNGYSMKDFVAYSEDLQTWNFEETSGAGNFLVKS
jgi:hypothetical protein